MNTKEKLPEHLQNVMVTYKKTFNEGLYGEKKVIRTVTKRGFYDKKSNNFAIPPEWAEFDGVLLPHGFGGDYLETKDVIKWEPIKDKS